MFLTCLPKDVPRILNLFNNYHERIVFVAELEEHSKLNFLDITLIKTPSNIIITDWYTKPTWSGRFLNRQSNVPIYIKINMVNNLLDRI